MVRKSLVEQLDSLNDILHFTFCFTENYIYICQFRKHSHPLLDAVNTISFQNCTDLIQRKNCNELQLIGSEAQSTYKCQPIIESFHVVNKSKGKFNYFPDQFFHPTQISRSSQFQKNQSAIFIQMITTFILVLVNFTSCSQVL